MNVQIKNAIENGRLILLLGAGASFNAKNKNGVNPPLGNELREILSRELNLSINDDDSLSEIYQMAKDNLQSRLINVLEKHYKHCGASPDYKEIIKFPFPRIYTLNIDDSFERAVSESEKYPHFNVYRRNDRIEDFDSLYEKISLIKLNGDINVPNEGFIFSPSEYAEGTASEPEWYKELANDFHRYTFLFIGAKLDEPLFRHVIERYKLSHNSLPLQSFLLTRNISAVKENNLRNYNIEYIQGDIGSFTSWLRKEFPNGLKSRDVLNKVRPEYSSYSDNLIVVNRATLTLSSNTKTNSKIKDFYRGFKPTWDDILMNVPADLAETLKLTSKILSDDRSKIFLILGPAGSGKTTALKQIALHVSENRNNVFYMDGVSENIIKLVDKLESLNERYYIFIDRIADNAAEIDKILNNPKYSNVVFVGAENIRIWKDRGSEYLEKYTPIISDYSKICEHDADLILEKLKVFGIWTRLEKMSESDRRREILDKSKKQLLIGLLEATSGEGYKDIINREYSSINNYNQKALLLLTGLATLQRSASSEGTLTRALRNLNIKENLFDLISKMEGIISYANKKIMTRHRVYIQELIYNFISPDELLKIIKAYISAFSVYQFPIVLNINKKDSAIYKGLINFKFLENVLRDEHKILELYEYFEKELEQEGLFLLQYGLALRAYKKHNQALEKLRIAKEAYSTSVHIEHAYAQQLLIIAENEKTDKHLILRYLEEAIAILRKIDVSSKLEIDLYPIITLSEGHIKVLHHLKREQESRELAGKYYNEISLRFPHTKEHQIHKTKTFLLKYQTTGILSKDK